MHVLQNIKTLNPPSTRTLTAEECRRSFSLGKKLFSAFLIANALQAQQIKDFHLFLTLLSSLEKSLRADFKFTEDIAPLSLIALVKVEEVLADFESPIAEVFKEDLTNLKFTLEHYLQE